MTVDIALHLSGNYGCLANEGVKMTNLWELQQNHYTREPFSPKSSFSHINSAFGVRTALSAEWTPAEGDSWKETDFEGDLKKLEKEAEERLASKIAELEGNIQSVGK